MSDTTKYQLPARVYLNGKEAPVTRVDISLEPGVLPKATLCALQDGQAIEVRGLTIADDALYQVLKLWASTGGTVTGSIPEPEKILAKPPAPPAPKPDPPAKSAGGLKPKGKAESRPARSRTVKQNAIAILSTAGRSMTTEEFYSALQDVEPTVSWKDPKGEMWKLAYRSHGVIYRADDGGWTVGESKTASKPSMDKAANALEKSVPGEETVLDVAISVLELSGEPLTTDALYRRVKQRRSDVSWGNPIANVLETHFISNNKFPISKVNHSSSLNAEYRLGADF